MPVTESQSMVFISHIQISADLLVSASQKSATNFETAVADSKIDLLSSFFFKLQSLRKTIEEKLSFEEIRILRNVVTSRIAKEESLRNVCNSLLA